MEVLETDEIEAYHLTRKEKLIKMKSRRKEVKQRQGIYLESDDIVVANGNEEGDPKPGQSLSRMGSSENIMRKIEDEKDLIQAEQERIKKFKEMSKTSQKRDFISYMPYPVNLGHNS